MRGAATTLGFLVGSMAAAGCGAPCDRLADLACQRQGAESHACLEIRKQAAHAGADDQGYCREALVLAGMVEKASQEPAGENR